MLRGVRSSWEALAKKADFCRLASCSRFKAPPACRKPGDPGNFQLVIWSTQGQDAGLTADQARPFLRHQLEHLLQVQGCRNGLADPPQGFRDTQMPLLLGV